MTIIGSTHFVVKLTSLSFDHFLHDVEISIQLLQEKVSLPSKDFFEACEVRNGGLDLLVLLHY